MPPDVSLYCLYHRLRDQFETCSCWLDDCCFAWLLHRWFQPKNGVLTMEHDLPFFSLQVSALACLTDNTDCSFRLGFFIPIDLVSTVEGLYTLFFLSPARRCALCFESPYQILTD